MAGLPHDLDDEAAAGFEVSGDVAEALDLAVLRREAGAPLSGQTSFGALSDLGVSFALDGTLTIDSTKLTAAFNTRFDDVGRALADPDDGLAVRLDALLDTYLDTGGLIEARTKGLQNSVGDISHAREALGAPDRPTGPPPAGRCRADAPPPSRRALPAQGSPS